MDANVISPAGAPEAPEPAAAIRKRDAVASPAVGGAVSPLRWRFTLESLWERKVNEVNALAGACLGVSAAGDDLPADGASLPSFRLYRRAARAYEELAAVADAIERVDAGTYGVCSDCGRLMPDEWLARDPATLLCLDCSEPASSIAYVVDIASVSCRSKCTTSWPA
jgi:RNA polymerase-binding transcription factor DksA